MRIFYVCYENLSLQRAPTTHVKEITEHLKKSGNDVILFAPNTDRLKGKTDVRVVYVPTLNVRFISEYVYYLSLFFYLLAYHAKFKADVIYLWEMGLSVAPALIGFVFRIPVILEINGIPFVGSFYPRHAPLHTIRILDHIRKRLPRVRLVMVGSGYLLENARYLTKELGLTAFVSFVGEVRYEDIPRYVTAC